MSVILRNLDFANAFLSAVSKAQRSIYLTSYVMSGNQKRASDPVSQLIDILADKAALGVDVRVLLDNPKKNRPNFHANRVYMRQLYDHKIPFGLCRFNDTLHLKTILIDTEILFIGSHNLAHRSLCNPFELTAEINDVDVCTVFKALFFSFWSDPSFFLYPPLFLDFERIYP